MSAVQAVSQEKQFRGARDSSAGPLYHQLGEETRPVPESHFLQWAQLPRRGYPCPVACLMYGMLRHEHGLRDIIQSIVEVALSRDLICMNSDLIVEHIERHCMEELSETLQADVSLQCRFTTGHSSQSSPTRR